MKESERIELLQNVIKNINQQMLLHGYDSGLTDIYKSIIINTILKKKKEF